MEKITFNFFVIFPIIFKLESNKYVVDHQHNSCGGVFSSYMTSPYMSLVGPTIFNYYLTQNIYFRVHVFRPASLPSNSRCLA